MTAQSNQHFSHILLQDIFSGQYHPGDFDMDTDYGTPEDLAAYINSEISPDSLKAYLFAMQKFETRNSGSDTLSDVRGIGAARTWILEAFQRFSERNNNRLITGYFEFDQDICGVGHHKNVVAMLPGTRPSDGVIIIEAHMDSRCEDGCDIDCLAQGMEDNGSGTVLVLELARVLSRYNYKNTLVFMTTTAEEQGLDGSRALATYAADGQVNIKMVQNNDVIGGIYCGETSSPPSCPGEGDVDSTQVRLFSYGGFNSPHKAITRFIKLQYEEMLKSIVTVPMQVTIMTPEDRTGRGGDHIPFRESGYPAMRFTCANEHGDGGIDPDYHDRQHTSKDILGVDTDGDGMIDSFYVDFNYLARNAGINAIGAVMAAIGPRPPVITGYFFDKETFYIEVEGDPANVEYRIGLRTDFNDFDTLYSLTGSNGGYFDTPNPELFIFLSVMAVDSQGIESLPSEEVRALFSSTKDVEDAQSKNITLHQNRPNPFDEATIISYWVEKPVEYTRAEVRIMDMHGNIIRRIPTSPVIGMNEVVYDHGYHATGIYVYALVIDGKVIDERQMVFAN